ncbi:DUF3293 domain-containing protein [Falsiroseomonas selenitidurans]|uniref:DUF3293 domain-containing protein n=1 Tax=Falsiroseomonas selenitidurans TaxID=2716335 RepID=A0ABX1E1J3_9PROT|nr:DUF3293 domain-containing protein [Falsiroseomonas selenitidurans]NKC29678.1 DUF3293 domain-containing protein [Falsiroseomonas selenitidurans]
MRAPPLAAFRATGYEAAGIVVRIGARSPAMEALLARHGARRAAFITAWNPRSRRMPAGWNRRMQDRLRQAAGVTVLAEGFGRGPGWAEHHLLLAGAPGRLLVLARRFRQWAIVALGPGQPARLLLAYRPSRAG